MERRTFIKLIAAAPVSMTVFDLSDGVTKGLTSDVASMTNLKKEAQTLGKAQWTPMLSYLADLHARSTHPPQETFQYPWEELGPGYCYGPAFGHWDIVHATIDVMPAEPAHAKNQIMNSLAAQQEDGLVPGLIWLKSKKRKFRNTDTPDWNTKAGHPPLWPIAVQDYADLVGSDGLIVKCYQPLIRQIRWFENFRKAEPIGFFYTDILTKEWESSVDDGIRFDSVQTGPFACIDATSHVYLLYEYAARWSKLVGKDPSEFKSKAL